MNMNEYWNPYGRNQLTIKAPKNEFYWSKIGWTLTKNISNRLARTPDTHHKSTSSLTVPITHYSYYTGPSCWLWKPIYGLNLTIIKPILQSFNINLPTRRPKYRTKYSSSMARRIQKWKVILHWVKYPTKAPISVNNFRLLPVYKYNRILITCKICVKGR